MNSLVVGFFGVIFVVAFMLGMGVGFGAGSIDERKIIHQQVIDGMVPVDYNPLIVEYSCERVGT